MAIRAEIDAFGRGRREPMFTSPMRGVSAMPCRTAVAVSPVAVRSAQARARPPAFLSRVASRLVRMHAAESDGGSLDDDDASASSSESLFTPEFSAAFRAAQERLDAKEAAPPERARINDEVAQIMARVEAERELEAALPVDDDEDANREAAKNQKLQEVEERFSEKLDNPLFTPAFKRAFIEAQERIAERNAPMMAKINDEVADIMAQVKAEREAVERGEQVDTSRPLRAGGGDLGPGTGPEGPDSTAESTEVDDTLDTLGSLFGGALDPSVQKKPPSPPLAPSSSPPPPASPDTEVLLQMKQSSEAQIDRLRASLSAIEGAVLAEQMQLQRIEFAIEKAAREARYAEADRVARERRERAEGEGER